MARQAKASVYTARFNEMVANVKATFLLGMQYRPVREAGLDWYENAHREAVQLSIEFGVTLRCACEVIAALSPNNKWSTNLLDAWVVFNTVKNDLFTPSDELGKKLRSLTYEANRVKAVKIARLNAEGASGILGGFKVNAFADTIEVPERDDLVVVDGHAFNICMNERVALTSVPKLKPQDYKLLSEVYVEAAHQLSRDNVEGTVFTPAQVQSLTWTVWRVIHGIDKSIKIVN